MPFYCGSMWNNVLLVEQCLIGGAMFCSRGVLHTPVYKKSNVIELILYGRMQYAPTIFTIMLSCARVVFQDNSY